MAHNLFSFNTRTGVRAGIRPQVGQYDRLRRRLLPPHISCGNEFVQINRGWVAPYHDGTLYEAELRTISPEGKRPFEVLDERQPTSSHLYLYADVMPRRMSGEEDPVRMVHTWTYLEVTGGVRIVMRGEHSGIALLEFHQDGGTAFLWSPDGSIYRIRREGDLLVEQPLRPTEIARMHVNQFREQLRLLSLDDYEHLRRFNEVVGVAVRLVRNIHDDGAKCVILAFLSTQPKGYLFARQQEDINELLLQNDYPNRCKETEQDPSIHESIRGSDRRKLKVKRPFRPHHGRHNRPEVRGPPAPVPHKRVQ